MVERRPAVEALRVELRDATPERRVQILAELERLGVKTRAVAPVKEHR